MNEPKRRGRPPKAKLLEAAEVAQEPSVLASVLTVSARDMAQAYALRVWNGQNTEMPRSIRLERVRKALEAQGLSMEGVSL